MYDNRPACVPERAVDSEAGAHARPHAPPNPHPHSPPPPRATAQRAISSLGGAPAGCPSTTMAGASEKGV